MSFVYKLISFFEILNSLISMKKSATKQSQGQNSTNYSIKLSKTCETTNSQHIKLLNISKNTNNMTLLYRIIYLYSRYSLNLFYRELAFVNNQNVPSEGPVIIYTNHNNLFLDPLILVSSIKRTVTNLYAAVSKKKSFINLFFKPGGGIPVERPRDYMVKGSGKIIQIKDKIVVGKDTKFTSIGLGSTLQMEGQSELRVAEIISDFELRIDTKFVQFEGEISYEVIPKLEFSTFFKNVWEALRQNKCIGMCPEGVGHDRLELIPFKVGICHMILGAMQKYNVPVKVVPCSFNYYNPHEFRSKVYGQFGPAFQVPQSLLQLYRQDKKKAAEILLEDLQNKLKALRMNLRVKDELNTFKEQRVLLHAQKLYTLDLQEPITVQEKLQLNRRFAKAYSLVIEDDQYKEFCDRMRKFSDLVSSRGLPLLKRSEQSGNRLTDFLKLLFNFNKLVINSALILPGLIIWGPPAALMSTHLEKERIKNMKMNKFRIVGKDVIASFKVSVASRTMPLAWNISTYLLYLALNKWSKLQKRTVITICCLFLVFSFFYAYIFTTSYDSIAKTWKIIKLLLNKMFKKESYDHFNREKYELQRKIFEIVEAIGPKVIENFQSIRILKKRQRNPAYQAELYERKQ